MKVESCQKCRKILVDFFAVTNFLGAGMVKIDSISSPLLRGTSTEKKSLENTPTNPEVIEAHTLNFRPNF